jgi:hypothetical protein
MLSPPQNQDAGDLKSAIFVHLFGGCFDGCSSSVSVPLLAIECNCQEGRISSLVLHRRNPVSVSTSSISHPTGQFGRHNKR